MKSRMTSKYKTGEIWIADLNPRQGTEAGKRRPVLIIQSQALLNANHPSTIILPLTTQLVEEAYPLRIKLPKNKYLEESDIMIDQIRSIDNSRLVKGPIVRLDDKSLEEIFITLSKVVAI